MPISTPRTQPPEVRRSSLLDGTQELLLRKSAEELTIEDITAAAGVAKGTFYLYFKSKSDLLDALRARLAEEILGDHERSLFAVPPTAHAARLDAWFREAIEGRFRRAPLHDALFHSGHGGQRSDDAHGHIAMLAGLLAEGRAAGQFQVTDPEVLAMLLYNAMHGAVDDQLHRGTPAPERLILEVQELARRAVTAVRPPQTGAP
jgi:AcrR family transcriptional regulator